MAFRGVRAVTKAEMEHLMGNGKFKKPILFEAPIAALATYVSFLLAKLSIRLASEVPTLIV